MPVTSVQRHAELAHHFTRHNELSGTAQHAGKKQNNRFASIFSDSRADYAAQMYYYDDGLIVLIACV